MGVDMSIWSSCPGLLDIISCISMLAIMSSSIRSSLRASWVVGSAFILAMVSNISARVTSKALFRPASSGYSLRRLPDCAIAVTERTPATTTAMNLFAPLSLLFIYSFSESSKYRIFLREQSIRTLFCKVHL